MNAKQKISSAHSDLISETKRQRGKHFEYVSKNNYVI